MQCRIFIVLISKKQKFYQFNNYIYYIYIISINGLIAIVKWYKTEII